MDKREKRSKERLTPSQARTARRHRNRRRKRAIRLGLLVAVGLVGLLFIAGLFAPGLPISIGTANSPIIGDHWHAKYTVNVCDYELDPFPVSPGGIHSHGDGDVHIHPRSASESGENATLALFFNSIGGELTDTTMTLPDVYNTLGRVAGRTYSFAQDAAGEACPELTDEERAGVGLRSLQVMVNGVINETPSSYVPQDGDEIEIMF